MEFLIIAVLMLVITGLVIVILLKKKTIITSSSILGRIEKIAELTTARLTVKHITEISNLSVLKNILPIAMRNMVLIIPVSIRGYIDLRSIKSEELSVKISKDSNSISLTVPSPQLDLSIPLPSLSEARIINQSGILVKLGDFIRGEDRFAMIQRSMPQIEKEVKEACLQDGLLETAQDSARNFFKGFLMGLGFSDVNVDFTRREESENQKELLQ
ncbi:MAG TPA: hypothetical protein DCE14_00550 [Kosmotogaceae bacterium]|nr:MAG: Uncharacterized protein XE05_0027 [Thermotogales bacterium 46_20]HAA84831.1 hypothetical protein [Kosmotogaceae bacterium]